MRTMKVLALVGCGAVLLHACSEGGNVRTGNAWIGRSIDDAIIRWGSPSERMPLERADSEVFVFTRSVVRPAADMTALCEKWGMSDEWSTTLCNSQEHTESCRIHAVVRPQGQIEDLEVVAGDTGPFGLCQQMLMSVPG